MALRKLYSSESPSQTTSAAQPAASATPAIAILGHMMQLNPAEVRDYLAGLAHANELEVLELRRTPAELKLRQLWTLMTSAHLFGRETEREAEALQVRERWLRLYEALDVRTSP